MPYEVGKNRPPTWSRFRPRQSGNPKGRPRGGSRPEGELPYASVMDQLVTISTPDGERTMTAEEAFLEWFFQKMVAGSIAPPKAMSRLIEGTVSRQPQRPEVRITTVYPTPGNIAWIMRPLGMAKLLDPYRPSAYLLLEHWVVDAALAKWSSEWLTIEQQEIVFASTRNPHKVRWPDWWAAC